MTRGRIAEGLGLPRDFPGAVSAMSKLQFRYKPAGQEESETFECYQITDNEIVVPRYYGIDKFYDTFDCSWGRGGHQRTNTLGGYEYDPIILREGQGPWVRQIAYEFQKGNHWDLVAVAPTGKGKTVMGIQIALLLGHETLIVVDQDNLKDQWIERIHQHLGIDRDKIGIFQGKQNKPSTCGFTIAMIQSLYSKAPGVVKEWSKKFGFTIFDECHTVGAPVFSSVLFMIGTSFRLGISATPDRRDAFDKVLKWHLGPTRVRMLQEHSRSTVRVVENYTLPTWYANISPKAGRYVSELAEDPDRNWSIVEIIRWFSEHNRRALILSDRIGHLESLIEACRAAGITESLGLYTRYYSVWKYAKEENPPRHPVGWERKTKYTPVCLQQVRVRKKAPCLQTAMQAQIIFATYAMFGKGIDLPALDAGLDATPRTFVKQIHGRILREQEGKVKPIWVTIRDVNSQRAEHQFKVRIRELEQSNAEVFQWLPERNQVRQMDAAELSAEAERRSRMLKSTRIVTSSDGRNTLEIPSMLKRKGAGSETTIEKRAVGKRGPHQNSTAASSSSVPKAGKSKSGVRRSRASNHPPLHSALRSARRRRHLAGPNSR